MHRMFYDNSRIQLIKSVIYVHLKFNTVIFMILETILRSLNLDNCYTFKRLICVNVTCSFHLYYWLYIFPSFSSKDSTSKTCNCWGRWASCCHKEGGTRRSHDSHSDETPRDKKWKSNVIVWWSSILLGSRTSSKICTLIFILSTLYNMVCSRYLNSCPLQFNTSLS